MKLYKIEAYATKTIITSTRVIYPDEKMPDRLYEDTINLYKDSMEIKSMEEITSPLLTETPTNEQNIVATKKPRKKALKEVIKEESK